MTTLEQSHGRSITPSAARAWPDSMLQGYGFQPRAPWHMTGAYPRHPVLHAYDQRLTEVNTGGQTGVGPFVATVVPYVKRSPP